jgi:hypothetical protein
LIAEVHAGKINSRVAANLAPLLNLQLRAIETTDLEWRIAKVERLLAKTQSPVALDAKRDAGVRGIASEICCGHEQYHGAMRHVAMLVAY